jgi:hypothetical protein
VTRPCRETGCGKEAEQYRPVCRGCRGRQETARNPQPRAWGPADDTDVQLIVEAPRPVAGLTRLERVLIARGIDRRLPAKEIARVVGVSTRTVYRWRTELPASATRSAA